MRYLIQTRFEDELKARQEYLYLVFKTHFIIVNRNQSFIEMQSFPFVDDHIILLYGHNNWIESFFTAYGEDVKNDIKVVTACDLFRHKAVLNGQKNLFYCKVDKNGYVPCYKGEQFNMSFDISQSELELLNNADLPFKEKVNFAYRRVS